MIRKILSITGTRADYGLMKPVHRAIMEDPAFELCLIVTGMHLLPEFRSSLDEIETDDFGRRLRVSMVLGEDSGKAMAQALGLGVFGIAAALESEQPDIVLVQGDRGEMLAAAIAAAHMNIPVVHMSGGDFTGTIDDSIRNAISKFAHFHLTICDMSTQQLLSMGEAPKRILTVGEPGIDVIHEAVFAPAEELATEFQLDLDRPILLATQHSVTTEAAEAAQQMRTTLEALQTLGLQTVITYPNSDSGGRQMAKVLESFQGVPWLRIVPNLGSRRYHGMMRLAAAMVGNSSSGIVEAPSFRLPVVNIGTRQYGRLRASNVVDVGYDRQAIIDAVKHVLHDPDYRRKLEECRNPYGDGQAARRTISVLKNLLLTPDFLAKWLPGPEAFLAVRCDEF